MPRALLVWSFVIAGATPGCGQSSPTPVRIDEWCVRMETAIRDRAVRCGCPGEPLDDAAIAARCEALPAATLLAAFADDAVGWNGAIASARVASVDDCDADPASEAELDDPVLGRVPAGAACQVFADAWGAPDDCAYGAECVAPAGTLARCVELVDEGGSCADASPCAPGLVCDAALTCVRRPEPSGGGAGAPCAGDGECRSARCAAGSCVAPVCPAP